MRNSIVAIILFILTIGIALGAGAYRSSASEERAQFQAKIPANDNAPVVLDLAKQSWPKKLLQPGKVTIYTGHGPMGIRNVGKEPLFIQVLLTEFPDEVHLEMDGIEYDEETFAFKNALQPGQLFKMDLSVDIPKEYRTKLIGFTAEIQFINQKDQSLINSIPVHVVNSNYGDPYEKLGINPNSDKGTATQKVSNTVSNETNKENSNENSNVDEECH